MRFQEIFEQSRDQVQFINIYIREAHPIDGCWQGRRLTRKPVEGYASKVSMDYYDPKDHERRCAVARDCNLALDYDVPTYVDDMDDAVNKAYAAWPPRLYLIGLDGQVVYAGGVAPYNYRSEEFKAVIEKYIDNI